MELNATSSWALPSEQKPLQTTASPLIEEPQPSQDELGTSEEGCLGCSTWPKTFALVIGLGVVCAAAVLIPLILTNTIGLVKGNTTSTITIGKSINHRVYFMNIYIILLYLVTPTTSSTSSKQKNVAEYFFLINYFRHNYDI